MKKNRSLLQKHLEQFISIIINIVIVKYTFSKTIAGYGKRREKKEIKIIKDFSRILGLSYHETQICVSDKNCIENVEIVYNGEDEVI